MSTDTSPTRTTDVTGERRSWLPPAALRRVGALVLLALPLVFLPLDPLRPEFVWSASNAAYSLGTAAAIFAILAYGIGTMLRFTGLASMGHGALFGVGAYATAIVMERTGLEFGTTLVFSMLTAGLVGAAVGALALRMHGMAFLIITIALGELIVLLMLNWESLTHGTLGMYMTETPNLFGIPIDAPLRRYLVAVVFLYLVIAAVWYISRSAFGRRLVAIRDNEALARSLGLDTFLHKLAIFFISAAIAGLAGQMYFMHLRAVTHDLFGVMATILVFLMVVMGGTRSLVGPAVGAWVVVFLPVWFGPLGLEDPHRQEIAFGLLLMVFMMVAPAGIVGTISKLADRANTRSGPAPAHAAATSSAAVPPAARAEPAAAVPVSATARAGNGGPGAVGETLLEVRDVSRAYGAVRAVDGVSFTVGRGEIVGLIGPNGSGKTTLVNCITGFQGLSGGKVLWKGGDVSKSKPHVRARKGIVRTFQQSMSFGEYTPREHCLLLGDPGEPRSADGLRLVDGIDELLAFFGLDGVADVPASDLPYGSVSNLGVASAVASRLPQLLVLDEPAAGLTSAEGLELQRRLLELRDRGLTLLVIDHDMSFLMPMCDRVVVLDAGKKVMEGPPAVVQQDSRVIAAYLGPRFAEKQSATEGSDV